MPILKIDKNLHTWPKKLTDISESERRRQIKDSYMPDSDDMKMRKFSRDNLNFELHSYCQQLIFYSYTLEDDSKWEGYTYVNFPTYLDNNGVVIVDERFAVVNCPDGRDTGGADVDIWDDWKKHYLFVEQKKSFAEVIPKLFTILGLTENMELETTMRNYFKVENGGNLVNVKVNRGAIFDFVEEEFEKKLTTSALNKLFENED